MIWFTSDEHFYHRNIIKLAKRPFASLEEMHSVMIDKHNKAVKEKDLVIHLGDFCFGSTGKYREILKKLNGNHVLILGNHDSVGLEAARNAGFDFACTQMELHLKGEKLILKHYPYKPSFFRRLINRFLYKYELRYIERRPKDEGNWLLHGHTHSPEKLKGKMINVCVDAWNFRPVSISEIEAIIRRSKK